MSAITIDIPEDVKATLDEAARQEGVSENTFTVRALKDYLFLRQFRLLRTRMLSESKTDYTDEEIFGLVS